MMSKKRVSVILGLTLAATIAAQGASASTDQKEAVKNGKWLTGEYHVHTYQSDDAQHSLTYLLDQGFENYGLDWMGFADHLRMESRDDNGQPLPNGSIPFSQGMLEYQVPKIKQLQQAGKYPGKIIFSGFEWDMPTYEHVGIGIITDKPGSEQSLKAASQFEYLFTNREEKYFDPADAAEWTSKDSRAFSTREDARTALNWLETNYKKTSFAMFNHPSRKTVYTISDFRDFNNIAPTVAFGFEGMVGNQMEPDRGGLNLATPKNRTYGGADYMLAQKGGAWDALLGEGRRFWNFANSDTHFFISDNRLYSSGYRPGEYSKNYTWVNGSDSLAVLNGMRSGKSFSVFGDLINALDFNITKGNNKAEMGGELKVKKNEQLTVTIKFKSPKKNNNGDAVKVDHVDLISGDVTGKAQPGTAAYNKETNDSTKVLKRFTSKEWITTKDGYNVITFKVKASDKNQYFRLRGTNLGVNVPGETLNGEPLMDEKTDIEDNEARFVEINKRNYKDLWFYSNPIFVSVK
ncbi:S-layer protein [Bacillus sp. FJAT-26390]|uniref:S-layer protein n=1 Tax=Bacillus sp. FJAT-26390 TaxID=1743142 RepID=UPI000807EEBC|nr:S-layer protein [Bacillus sp. FJAT-26390]OBZ09499.1 S-layer protein [Bacillus sp. FJAT-26390]